MTNFIASLIDMSGLGVVLDDLSITCLDVGARRGFTEDVLPIARAVNAIGFEPDTDECERLNASAGQELHPWRNLRFLPVALAAKEGTRRLNLYSQPGCSSLLEADVALAALYSRQGYYDLVGTVDVPSISLDAAAGKFGFLDASYLKIDIQGGELEVFSNGRRLLGESLVAIRTEVSFVPTYKDQPLFADIDIELRRHGFVPMEFLELHHWRRTTRIKHPNLAGGELPFSKGQMVHGDVLYFRHPEDLCDSSERALERLLKAAFLAVAYEHIDHAAAILERTRVARYLDERYAIRVPQALGLLSAKLGQRRGRRAPSTVKKIGIGILRRLQH